MAQNGANVVFNGFGDAAEIQKLRKGISAKTSVEILYNGADMSKASSIKDMIDTVNAAWGGIDILVNNAVIQFVAPIDEFSPEKWEPSC